MSARLDGKRIVIKKVENGFVYIPLSDSGPLPISSESDIREWISGNDAAEIGRTVLKIFDASQEKH